MLADDLVEGRTFARLSVFVFGDYVELSVEHEDFAFADLGRFNVCHAGYFSRLDGEWKGGCRALFGISQWFFLPLRHHLASAES
mgnify:CR=1 FL=1